MELRNFFEDHREEMMTMLNDPSSSAPGPSKANSRLGQLGQNVHQQGGFFSPPADSGTDWGELERERRAEFEKRR